VTLDDKYNSLQRILKSFGRVVLAYSGGVDSAFLLKVSVDTLGTDNVLACIGISPSLAQSQLTQAVEVAQMVGVNALKMQIDELADTNYAGNKADRCFHCKSHLYARLTEIAKTQGIEHMICGSNYDDKDDYRPGNKVAKVFAVRAPLAEAKLTKDDIRQLSRKFNLPTANMPASPCLASRITYGLEVTAERLNQVEKAEDFLRSLGFVEFRVRHQGDTARIEVKTNDIEKVVSQSTRTKIVEKLKTLGFKFVSVDLQGFRSGALNESLSEAEKQKNL